MHFASGIPYNLVQIPIDIGNRHASQYHDGHQERQDGEHGLWDDAKVQRFEDQIERDLRWRARQRVQSGVSRRRPHAGVDETDPGVLSPRSGAFSGVWVQWQRRQIEGSWKRVRIVELDEKIGRVLSTKLINIFFVSEG